MAIKKSNEITVKVLCKKKELIKMLENKGFRMTDTFSLDDYYFINELIDISNMSIREILSKAIILRSIIQDNSKYKFVYKIKDIDDKGNILKQESINCDLISFEDGYKFINSIGFKELMNIKEDDIVYEKDGLELVIKDVNKEYILMEAETNELCPEISDLIRLFNQVGIPIVDDFFIKKAEIELGKVLRK